MKLDINQIKNFFKDAVVEIQTIYADKGAEPFKKPGAISAAMILIVYFGIYSPSKGNLQIKADELSRYELLAPFYDDYVSYRNSAAQNKKNLPMYKDKDEWLDVIIRTNSQKNGVVADSISAQTESELTGGFIVAHRAVTIRANYETIGKLVADIENSPVFVKITDFNLKKEGDLGMVTAEFKISTVFIKPGGI